MKRHLVSVVKIALPVAILVWLLCKESDAIYRLITRPKDIGLLTASLACLLAGTCLSFVRWFLLVRALEIPFTIREAFRLGFLGYLFNFVGPSAIGGDLIKAYLVARERTQRRAEVVATILLDRMVGMFSLFVVATTTILIVGTSHLSELQSFLRLVVLLTLVGAAGIGLLLSPSRFSDRLFARCMRIPVVGPFVGRARLAIDLYRKRRFWLFVIGLLSILIHVLVAVSMHFSDRSVHPATPRLTEHLIISPLASLAGAVPVPGGLGTYELTMDYLFQKLPEQTVERGQGLAVAVVYRLLTIIIAAIGIVYYWLNHRDISEAMSTLESPQREAGPTSQRFTEETEANGGSNHVRDM